MPKTWPALDLFWTSSAPPDPTFVDTLALALDDVQPLALEEGDDGRTWRVYFDNERARENGASLLRVAVGADVDVRARNIEDEGWTLKVQQDLRTVRVGRIVVAPPWDVPGAMPAEAGSHEGGADHIVIVIDPSMGFGTGHHQSTRLCLGALQAIPLGGATVLDVGTGSGVLALAAARLGAARVVAIDNDEDSLVAARENLARNDLAERVDVRHGDAGLGDLPPAGVVIANLTATLLRRYADAIAGAVTPAGRLVVSGFTEDQVSFVTDAFANFAVEHRFDEDDWVALVFARR